MHSKLEIYKDEIISDLNYGTTKATFLFEEFQLFLTGKHR